MACPCANAVDERVNFCCSWLLLCVDDDDGANGRIINDDVAFALPMSNDDSMGKYAKKTNDATKITKGTFDKNELRGRRLLIFMIVHVCDQSEREKGQLRAWQWCVPLCIKTKNEMRLVVVVVEAVDNPHRSKAKTPNC